MYYLIKYHTDYLLIESYNVCHPIDIEYEMNHYLGLSKLIVSRNRKTHNFWKVGNISLSLTNRRCLELSNFTSMDYYYRFMQIDDPINLIIEIKDSELIKMIDSVVLGNDPDTAEYIMGVILNKYNIKQDE